MTADPMTPADFRAALERAGLSQVGAADPLGVTPRTIRRWAAGKTRIPELAREKLLQLAGQAAAA